MSHYLSTTDDNRNRLTLDLSETLLHNHNLKVKEAIEKRP